MKHKTLAKSSLPVSVLQRLQAVGEQVRIARKRRGLTMEEMAARMFVSRQTLARLEKGDPGVTLAVVASALWVLGLEHDLGELASPDRDEVGKFRERQKLPQRVRGARQSQDLEF